MVNRSFSICLRIVTLILVMISAAMTASAVGKVCRIIGGLSDPNPAGQGGGKQAYDACKQCIDITCWVGPGSAPGGKIHGQIFVFMFELLFILITGAMLVVRFMREDERRSNLEVGLLCFMSLFSLVTGAVEVWQCTGFSTLTTVKTDIVIIGWVLAAAFLLLSSIFYAIDACISAVGKY